MITISYISVAQTAYNQPNSSQDFKTPLQFLTVQGQKAKNRSLDTLQQRSLCSKPRFCYKMLRFSISSPPIATQLGLYVAVVAKHRAFLNCSQCSLESCAFCWDDQCTERFDRNWSRRLPSRTSFKGLGFSVDVTTNQARTKSSIDHQRRKMGCHKLRSQHFKLF